MNQLHRPQPSARQIKAARAEIARRYTWHEKQKARGGAAKRADIGAFRRSELNRLFADRYGPSLPDDDAGRSDLLVMFDHFSATTAAERRASRWAAIRAPWLSRQELEQLLDMVMNNPRRWKADALGVELGLTATTRERLKIRTIGACDVTKRQRLILGRKRRRLKETQRRSATGAKPHIASITRLKPWEKDGISRRTWYRRQSGITAEAAE